MAGFRSDFRVWHAASIGLALVICLASPVWGDDPSSSPVTVEGVVRPLAEIAKAKNVAGDAEPLAGVMSVEAADGRAILIRSDEGGRVFYLDPAMRGRKVRLKIIERADFPVAEVIQVEALHEGRWRVPQYYCDVCTIAVRYPQVCLCCQGPMEFRYKPER